MVRILFDQVWACCISKHRYLGSGMSNLGVSLGLGVVMTAWVVNTRVVIGGQTIILSSMGMLHIKT